MAVKAPTPPTPPTPPAVPGVTLSEGGSVTQSNAPPANGTTSRSTDNEKQMEEQAREAVANGSGGLSRTTQKNPAAEARAAKEAAREAGQAGAKQAQATVDTGRSQARQAANLDSNAAAVQEGDGAVSTVQGTAATLQAESSPKSFDYQGLTYWGPMLALGFVIAFALVKKFLHRQGRKGELTKADLDIDGLETVEYNKLRGLTPDEVLRRLEKKEEKVSASQKRQSNKGKKPVRRRDESQEEEHKHFEVRI